MSRLEAGGWRRQAGTLTALLLALAFPCTLQADPGAAPPGGKPPLSSGIDPQACPAPAPPTGTLPPAAGDNPAIYGNTPNELVPYHNFVQHPYSRFFVDQIEYLGPWRRKPEPEVSTVKIGLITPLERSYESYLGQDILHGMQLAIDEANAQGGYHGKPFELVVRNDSGLWGASANEVAKLAYDDQVRVLVGTVDSANTHIAMRVALKIEIPLINVGDSDPTMAETRIPWTFRVVPDDRQEAYTLAFYLYKQLGLQQVAVLRANNRYGRFGVAKFLRSSERLARPAPLEINYETTWAETNPDFTMQLDRLRQVQPEALVLWADAAPAGRIVRKLREAGMTMPVYACDRIIHPEFFSEAGKYAEGVVAVTPFNPEAEVPALQQLRAHYQERFGKELSSFAAHAYDGAWMAVGAIRQAGLNWAKIRDALATTSDFTGITGDIHFNDDLSNRRRVTLATVQDGKFVYGVPKTEVQF